MNANVKEPREQCRAKVGNAIDERGEAAEARNALALDDSCQTPFCYAARLSKSMGC
jgi:hypothetical protein